MQGSAPQIGLLHIESIPVDTFTEFEVALRADNLNLRVESRPDPGPYAGVEWLIPTAVFVYISKSYFDAFLKEAGKDHYQVLRSAISRLSGKYFGKDAPRGRMVFTAGKAEAENPRYSIFYSVVADLGDGFRVKLLLQSDLSVDACNEAQGAFLDFLDAANDGTLDRSSIKGLIGAKPIGQTLLLAYDLESKALEVVDPLAGKRGGGA